MKMCLSLALTYVFAVFNVQYYYAPMWLELSFMFPLVIHGYFLLMNVNRSRFYIIALALTLMMSFQHSYMIMLFLILMTGALALLSKERYCDRLTKLLFSTIIAMMLASWIWIPAFKQIMMGSSRANRGFSIIEIWDSVWVFYTAKWMKLLNMNIPLSIFMLYIYKNRKSKAGKFFLFAILILSAPIVLESTNILWHGGLYEGYTMRFAYMLPFWIIMAGAYAYNKVVLDKGGGQTPELPDKQTMGKYSFYMLLILNTLQYLLLRSDAEDRYKDKIPAVFIIAIILIGVALGLGLLRNGRGRYENYVLITTVYSIMALSLNSIIVPGTVDSSYIAMSNEAAADRGYENGDPFMRMKCLGGKLSHNYPLVMGVNSASDYLAVDGRKQLDGLRNLGYAKVGDRMSSYGGTLFTDALLGVNEAISCESVNDTLYQYERTYKNYSVYHSIYQYGQGILIKGENKPALDTAGADEDPFTYQNRLAKCLLGKELFTTETLSGREVNVRIDEESVLYLYSDQVSSFDSVVVRDVQNRDEYVYELSEPEWNIGILELGTYKDTDVNVRVHTKENIDKISYALLPLQHFKEMEPEYCDNYNVVNRGNSLHISLKGAKNGDGLFLPIYHDNGWKARVNGRIVSIEEFADYFITVPLQDGTNEITLFFVPEGLKLGVIVSLIGVLILAITWKFPITYEWGKIGRTILFLDRVVFVVLMMVFYVIPILFMVKKVFTLL